MINEESSLKYYIFDYLREEQGLCTERLPSMTNPLWWSARPLTTRVKGREWLGNQKKLKKIW